MYGGNRRVPGLRREEVALLAGISIDYYVRLERGNLNGASESVLDGIARPCSSTRPNAPTSTTWPAPDPGAAAAPPRPAVAAGPPERAAGARRDGRRPGLRPQRPLDILAANELGRALYAPVFDSPPPSTAGEHRPVRCSSTRRARLLGRLGQAPPTTPSRCCGPRPAATRTTSPHRPDRGAATRSDRVPDRWAAHDVRFHRTGVKRFHHPVVGDLTLTFEALDLPPTPGCGSRLHARARLSRAAGSRAPRQLGRQHQSGPLTRRPLDVGVGQAPASGNSRSWEDLRGTRAEDRRRRPALLGVPALARRPVVLLRLLPPAGLSVAYDGSDLRVEAEVPGQPSGLGWLPDGRLLIVSMHDTRLLRREADGSW